MKKTIIFSSLIFLFFLGASLVEIAYQRSESYTPNKIKNVHIPIHGDNTMTNQQKDIWNERWYIEDDCQIEEEIYYDDLELLAQLCYAEAGNQGLYGMQLVADVVLNRVDDPGFPNTIRDVIFDAYQFSPVNDGRLDLIGWEITNEAFQAAEIEMFGDRIDPNILYFSNTDDPVNGVNPWRYKDHWFSY